MGGLAGVNGGRGHTYYFQQQTLKKKKVDQDWVGLSFITKRKCTNKNVTGRTGTMTGLHYHLLRDPPLRSRAGPGFLTQGPSETCWRPSSPGQQLAMSTESRWGWAPLGLSPGTWACHLCHLGSSCHQRAPLEGSEGANRCVNHGWHSEQEPCLLRQRTKQNK